VQSLQLLEVELTQQGSEHEIESSMNNEMNDWASMAKLAGQDVVCFAWHVQGANRILFCAQIVAIGNGTETYTLQVCHYLAINILVLPALT